MIAQNEINLLGGLANKTSSGTVSYKHRTGRILVQIKQETLSVATIAINFSTLASL